MTGSLTDGGRDLAGTNPRVAVVWMQEDRALNVAEDLPVQPVFPSRFVLPLRRPPPEGAMIVVDAAEGLRMAVGALVAYDDRNGNGALDLVADDAGRFVDAVLGTNPTLAVAFFEGRFPPEPNGTVPPPGYALITPEPACARGRPPAEASSCDWDSFLPIDHPYELVVSDDPEVNALMCASYGKGGNSVTTSSTMTWIVDRGPPPQGYPAPGRAVCAPDGSSYTTSSCERSGDLCHSEKRCTDWTVLLLGVPRPAGWPCP